MKTLQNNFTTPEQSKRLLELGVPANSADCVYRLKQVGTKMIMSSTPDIIPNMVRLTWNDKHPKVIASDRTKLPTESSDGEITRVVINGKIFVKK